MSFVSFKPEKPLLVTFIVHGILKDSLGMSRTKFKLSLKLETEKKN